jgi:hypothetical protein
MTKFRPNTSFPYLKVAREHDVEYWRVLDFAGLVEKWPPKQSDWNLRSWQVAVCMAWVQEQNRRRACQA